MKKLLSIIILVCCFPGLSAQYDQHDVVVRNIEVPVRVYDGSTFMDKLTIGDFEVFEGDTPQTIEALYIIRNNQIAKHEGEIDFMPFSSRHYFFLFQMTEYNPKITEAVDFFMRNVFLPDDTLSVTTPIKNYNLSSEAIQSKPVETIVKDMQAVIRRDTKVGSTEYNTLLKDLGRIARSLSSTGGSGNFGDFESSMGGDIGNQLARYRQALQKMEELRVIKEDLFIQFARQLKRVGGQKNVFFFYQREFRPEIQAARLQSLMEQYRDQPNIIGTLQDLFLFYHRDISLDTEKLNQAFADASINFNLIYLNKDPGHHFGIHMREQSEDVFDVLSQITDATGGIIDSSQNPAAAIKNTAEKSGTYYLLYYRPKNYIADKTFKNITVRVKEKEFTVIHRKGYIAD
ncbi:MAG: VWA domain-containing protein [Acidobacteria bacterium]|nr:VWA domain-containing protein [Acidobacteriota bacterium]MBU1473859.1 VWA domain-containing protein [Acidobacteriota bacterium]MBU4330132.1 VWA domain-containing protein [Acidobacteriota bacterium]MCG2816805.1 VWA domain-containing protein [Candidatus Aminicenantes bacterium]